MKINNNHGKQKVCNNDDHFSHLIIVRVRCLVKSTQHILSIRLFSDVSQYLLRRLSEFRAQVQSPV